MAKTIEYRISLTSKGHRYTFPIDMLRYDRAIPGSETDAGLIERTFNRDHKGEPAVIMVKAPNPPTVGRWESFGWTVTNVEKRVY